MTEGTTNVVNAGFGPSGVWLNPGQSWAREAVLKWRAGDYNFGQRRAELEDDPRGHP